MADKNIKVEEYYDHVGGIYDKMYIDNISLAENKFVNGILSDAVEQINNKRIKILDLGCGTGLGATFFEDIKSIEYEYIGIDISQTMIKQAQCKFSNNPNASFVLANIEDLSSFSSNSIDIVVSFFGAFSHITNYNAGIKEIYRILKPEGKVLMMVYSRYSISAIYKRIYKNESNALDIKREYTIRNDSSNATCSALFYTSSSIRKIFRTNSFVDIHCRGMNTFFEIRIVKSLAQKLSVKAISRLLKIESALLKLMPSFSHTLIVQARKKEGY